MNASLTPTGQDKPVAMDLKSVCLSVSANEANSKLDNSTQAFSKSCNHVGNTDDGELILAELNALIDKKHMECCEYASWVDLPDTAEDENMLDNLAFCWTRTLSRDFHRKGQLFQETSIEKVNSFKRLPSKRSTLSRDFHRKGQLFQETSIEKVNSFKRLPSKRSTLSRDFHRKGLLKWRLVPTTLGNITKIAIKKAKQRP
ncbi:hypothetical protein BgiBS90_008821 [Biomphalaria glabrata]|nr:hypothetical protein BgiBS90_008821 [Biomphalaria glabrata]